MLEKTKQRIPNLLRKYRKARGLNQRQAAALIGIRSTSIISRWERGLALPSVLNIFKLAALYRTMADVMFPELKRRLQEEIIKREKKMFQISEAKAS